MVVQVLVVAISIRVTVVVVVSLLGEQTIEETLASVGSLEEPEVWAMPIIKVVGRNLRQQQILGVQRFSHSLQTHGGYRHRPQSRTCGVCSSYQLFSHQQLSSYLWQTCGIRIFRRVKDRERSLKYEFLVRFRLGLRSAMKVWGGVLHTELQFLDFRCNYHQRLWRLWLPNSLKLMVIFSFRHLLMMK